MAYIGVSPGNGVRKKHTHTADANQTSFSGTGAEGVTLSYKDSNFVDVYQNGVKLSEADYTSTSGTAIVLASAATVSDIIEIIIYDVFSVADSVSKNDGGTFDGNVSFAGNLSIGSTAITSTGAELNILDGVTSTAAELNILDGVTSTAAELNILDGVTSTAAELNILDGVTSTAAELNILDGVTSTTAELNILDGVTSTAAELNILDGVTSTAAELNALDGITAVVGELNALDIGSTAVGTGVASKAVILDSNKDYTGIRNLTISGELDAATLDISGAIDVAGTSNLDVVDIDGAVDMASTLAVAGVVTANAGVVVDNITIDGTQIDLSSGDLTLDVAGDIILDAGGQNIVFKDDGTEFGQIYQSSNHLHLFSSISDADIKIQGNDGGATITAVLFDMSDGGSAYFNNTVYIPQYLAHTGNTDTHLEFATNQINLYANTVRGVSINSDEVIINQDSADVDFRVESNGQANMLVVNGGTDSVQINTNADLITGSAVLSVNGQVEIETPSGSQCFDMKRGNAGLLQNFRKASGSSVGNITITDSGTSFNESSDYRLKENVVTDWDATTRLKQLKPSRFNFIIDADTTVDGFLAHEVQAIVPEAVTGAKDAVEVWNSSEELPDGVSAGDNKLDSDGNTIPDMQSIDKGKLVPLLTKALQEQQATIEALTARIVTLEG